MKRIFLLLAAMCLPLCSKAAFINGQNYISLIDWARANSFRTAALDRDEIVLTNRTSRLVFDTDSADAVINGIHVRLSFPIAKGALISPLDVETALRPLLFQKITPKRTVTICLDPGHGGKDTGNRVPGFFWHNEKNYTLALAFELRDQLKNAGFKVLLTRYSDTFVELPSRPAVANRAGADLFISLHFNAAQADRGNVQGPETYCITPVGAASSNAQGEGADHGATIANRVEDKSLMFAYQMQKSLVQNLHVEDRDVRRARFAVLRDAAMPAILIEGGYMTHPVEGKRIFDPVYRREMAAAMVKGILAYQKLAAPPAPVVPPAVNATNAPSAKAPEPASAPLPKSGNRFASPRQSGRGELP